MSENNKCPICKTVLTRQIGAFTCSRIKNGFSEYYVSDETQYICYSSNKKYFIHNYKHNKSSSKIVFYDIDVWDPTSTVIISRIDINPTIDIVKLKNRIELILSFQ